MHHAWFQRLIGKLYSKPYIIVTNTVTGVVSISIGDVLQQNLEHIWSRDHPSSVSTVDKVTHNEDKSSTFVWDSSRTKFMMSAGVYLSSFGHFWYSYLDKRFPPHTAHAVRNKVLAEIGMGPPLVASSFFIVGSLKGQSLTQCWEYMKSNYLTICAVEWAIFMPIQWLNFSYVPAKYRYLYVAAISIGYDAFLSFILHRNERYQLKATLQAQLGDASTIKANGKSTIATL